MKEKMFFKRQNCIVDVYHYYENGTVLIYSSVSAGSTQGQNGWEKVKIGQLVPLEYYEQYLKNGFMSKTEKNKIKSKLKLHSAEWETEDGLLYNDIDEAIQHQKELMEKENGLER